MKTATIKVFTYDIYDEENYVTKHEMPLSVAEMNELSKWTTADNIRKFMHDNCVGLHDSISNNKFIPCIEVGKLCVSCQINYQVWSLRTDRLHEQGKYVYNNNEYLEKNVTEEEFNAVLPDNEKMIDVKVSYDGSRCFLGQMTLNQVASVFSDILYELKTEFYD